VLGFANPIERFLVNVLLDTDDEPINVVHNWTAELKR
jgi:hypothetical protein